MSWLIYFFLRCLQGNYSTVYPDMQHICKTLCSASLDFQRESVSAAVRSKCLDAPREALHFFIFCFFLRSNTHRIRDAAFKQRRSRSLVYARGMKLPYQSRRLRCNDAAVLRVVIPHCDDEAVPSMTQQF